MRSVGDRLLFFGKRGWTCIRGTMCLEPTARGDRKRNKCRKEGAIEEGRGYS